MQKINYAYLLNISIIKIHGLKMARYTSNQLRNFEVDNSSNWVVSFTSGNQYVNINNLNTIAKRFVPAIDVEFNNIDINKESLMLGHGVSYEYTTHIKPTRTMKLYHGQIIYTLKVIMGQEHQICLKLKSLPQL